MLSAEEIGDLAPFAVMVVCGIGFVWAGRRAIGKKPGEEDYDERQVRFAGRQIFLGILATVVGVVQIVRIIAKALIGQRIE